ncbi:DUF817 domain-containing protein [Wielerella bovis]|uniref:DUF817 domain-containing protein n=1 Tax=Wielerella bovis TaxID=2917790 RepID=UPI0020192220|nr:DUF817 domain-containing protein [Wielerella bovis]ULJ62749.1 DUF817 domain-containing protein [Wielerella bovis]
MHAKLDKWLCEHPRRPRLHGFPRFLTEFWFFGLKEARACVFAGLFFVAMFLVPKSGILGLPRYDVLLIFAIVVQLGMLWAKWETWDEIKSITLFHIVGFILELFKTSPDIQATLLPADAHIRASWAYPDFAYSKVFGVPLFTGFMYAAVASYIIQAWRLFDLHVYRMPPYGLATLTAIAIYLNFFTHHAIADLRWYIAAFVMGLYARSYVVFTPYDTPRKMPILLAFVLIGFFIWLAENIGTVLGIWQYPNQIGAWSLVHISKFSSWSLLVIMTFTIVTHLKHIKATVFVAK